MEYTTPTFELQFQAAPYHIIISSLHVLMLPTAQDDMYIHFLSSQLTTPAKQTKLTSKRGYS